jgi:hypothetical protein
VIGQRHTGCSQYTVAPEYVNNLHSHHQRYLALAHERTALEKTLARLERNGTFTSESESLYQQLFGRFLAITSEQRTLRQHTDAEDCAAGIVNFLGGLRGGCQLWRNQGMDTPSAPTTYKNHRFPVEIISHAVWLYFRFCLSFRDVEELLLERGVVVTYEAIRKWCRKFGQQYANQLRRRRPRLGDKWHLDEVVLTIKGERH